jgi:S-adenosylmethionine-diacylgycerolhomoserine-N-methlytransferase
VTLVDLCPALLDVARNRCRLGGWSNVRVVQGDAVTWTPPDCEPVDVVLFSYSLTMIPEWSRAIDNALRMLRPGGSIGIVDFMVSRRQPALLRAFWGAWFGHNDVHPSLDHIPFLVSRTRTTHLSDHPLPVPYLPFLRARYYLFVGRKETARPAGIPPPHTILTSPQRILNEDRLYPQHLEKRRQRASP